MAFCGNCGKEVTEGIKFCPSCGAPMKLATESVVPNPQPQQAEDSANNTLGNKLEKMNATTDTTEEFSKADIEQNKVMALLSYFGILVLIPLIGAKESKFARFHANQGLILCIACILYGVAYSILSAVILAISWRLYFVVSLIGLLGCVFAILAIIGIVNALNGKAKELPFIGKYKILK